MQLPMDRDGHSSNGDQEPLHDAEADVTKLKWPGETHGLDWKRGCVYGFGVALGWLWGGFGLRSICLVYAYYMALRWLRVALPRLSRLEVGCSTFDVRCSGPRTVPVRSGSEWAWVSDLLAPSCPRGRCEPGRFAVRSRA